MAASSQWHKSGKWGIEKVKVCWWSPGEKNGHVVCMADFLLSSQSRASMARVNIIAIRKGHCTDITV